jgi:hypothetical protein
MNRIRIGDRRFVSSRGNVMESVLQIGAAVGCGVNTLIRICFFIKFTTK